MPALIPYLPPQLGTGDAPVAQHDDCHFLWNRWSQGLQQFHGGVCPRAFLGGFVDAPGHRDGVRLRRTVEHADDDGRGLITFERGVNGQGQWAGAPPGENPPEQRREAERNVQLGLAGAGPVAAVVEPLPKVLAEAVPSAPGRECRGYGVLVRLRRTAGQDGPTNPQYQAGQLWLGEVG